MLNHSTPGVRKDGFNPLGPNLVPFVWYFGSHGQKWSKIKISSLSLHIRGGPKKLLFYEIFTET